jgi:hypothetical protein
MQIYSQPDLAAPFHSQKEHEWSDAAECGFDTLRVVKKARAELIWFGNGDVCQRSSSAITIRWSELSKLVAAIRRPAEKYSPGLMTGIAADLAYQLRIIDEANMDFEDSDNIAALEEGLSEYAHVIIKALEREMGDSETELFHDNTGVMV